MVQLGKTVAINGIPYLLNHHCFANYDRVLMVNFDKMLIKYIKYIYDKVEEENELDYARILGSDKNKLVIYNIDGFIYKYYRKSIKK